MADPKDTKKPDAEMTTAQAIAELAKQLKPQTVYEKAGLSPARVAQLTEPTTPLRHRRVACKSEDTGATFTACVIESRTHPNGRIVALENYTHPPGTHTYRANGGLVPDQLQILRAGIGAPQEGDKVPRHDYNIFYLQWRWEEFWQKDLRRYAGKPLLSSHVVEPAGFKTEWIEGSAHMDETG